MLLGNRDFIVLYSFSYFFAKADKFPLLENKNIPLGASMYSAEKTGLAALIPEILIKNPAVEKALIDY